MKIHFALCKLRNNGDPRVSPRFRLEIGVTRRHNPAVNADTVFFEVLNGNEIPDWQMTSGLIECAFETILYPVPHAVEILICNRYDKERQNCSAC